MTTLIGWCGLVILLAWSTASAQTADTLRLETVIEDVLRHNDQVAAMRFMEQAARDKVGPAGAWNDPMLMVGVENLPTSFDFREDMMTMTMVGLSQEIPYAGQTGLKAKAARAEADAAGQSRHAMETDLATAATRAYIEVYYRRDALAILRLQRSLQEDVVAAARGRLISNQTAQEDVSAAQAALWRLDADILSAEQALDAAWLNLSALRGQEVAAAIPPLADPAMGNIPGSVDDWVSDARVHYPPLRRLEFEARSYSLSAAASRRMRWPMLELNAQYNFRRDSPMEERDDMVGFGATLSLPVFRGRQEGAMARSMEAMARGVDAEHRQLLRTVTSTLNTLHRRAVRLDESVRLYRDRIVPASEDAFRGALAGYNTGRASFITLVDYAVSVQRDRLTAVRLAEEYAVTLAEAGRFTTDPARLAGSTEDQ